MRLGDPSLSVLVVYDASVLQQPLQLGQASLASKKCKTSKPDYSERDVIIAQSSKGIYS
jgi:hypothetical protein